ncbi:MAG TPA: alpha/beta hydrolase [Phototrophicaceae bacterium]|jgi:pimeloyl-ACP methyl ester carboxylesterase|nr:alpha/beta hydrolase [Phototrophicaceae bacterium]
MFKTIDVQTGYAPVNGLKMYYEIHGIGKPIIVIHGAYMAIEAMGAIVPRLGESRQVIAVELQGHGHTGDIADRPLSYEALADDIDALMAHLNIETADILGYSMGGGVALQVALQHPERVNKLILVSSSYNSQGWYPEMYAAAEHITPEIFIGSPMEAEYQRVAPNPENFGTLVTKLLELTMRVQDVSPDKIRAIQAPMLIIVGDADNIRLEHALDLYKLRGGGVPGDIVGAPASQLAIIPGATHTMTIDRVDVVAMFTNEFLNAAPPAPPAQ